MNELNHNLETYKFDLPDDFSNLILSKITESSSYSEHSRNYLSNVDTEKGIRQNKIGKLLFDYRFEVKTFKFVGINLILAYDTNNGQADLIVNKLGMLDNVVLRSWYRQNGNGELINYIQKYPSRSENPPIGDEDDDILCDNEIPYTEKIILRDVIREPEKNIYFVTGILEKARTNFSKVFED